MSTVCDEDAPTSATGSNNDADAAEGQQSSSTASSSTAAEQQTTDPPTATETTKTDADTTAADDDTNNKSQSYLSKLSDMQKEAMETLYANTIDAPCQRVHALEHSIHESFSTLDINCRQFDFLHFLKTEQGHVDENLYARNAPIGPTHCEYCGEASVEDCGPNCQRPQLFFRKKRPPFKTFRAWDPITEHEVEGGGEHDTPTTVEFRPQQNGTGGSAHAVAEEQQQSAATFRSIETANGAEQKGEVGANGSTAVVSTAINKEEGEESSAWEPFGKSLIFEC